MTLTFPRTDIMTFCRFAPSGNPLRLVPRQELSSRTAGGTIYGKDFGNAVWNGSWTTIVLPNDDALTFEAMLNSLDGVIKTFEGCDPRKPYPKLHADGNFTDSGKINSVADGRKISLKSLPTGLGLSVGDYLSFDVGSRRMLHQVMESVTVNGSGVTDAFEVRPYLLPGTVADISVRLKRPCGLFSLLPDSVQPQYVGPMHTQISFQAVQSL